MLNTLGDIIGDFLITMGTTTMIGNYTDAMLGTWASKAHSFAAARHKWPFTERRDISQTWSSGTEDYPYPSDFKSDSIRLLQVGGYWLQKLDFNDYQRYRQEQPGGSKRYYSDFGRRYYINPFIDVSGTVTAWGQFIPPLLDKSDPTALTVFSGAEDEGNEAIVTEMMSYAAKRETDPNQAKLLHQNAKDILDELWVRIGGDQFQNQTSSTPMWKRIDVVGGYTRSNVSSINQFL